MNIRDKEIPLKPDWPVNFIRLSSTLTDFSPYALQGTGQAEDYLKTLVYLIGEDGTQKLFLAFEACINARSGCLHDQENAQEEKLLLRDIQKNIMGDYFLGPIARNIIKLWYTGQWYQMPSAWRQQFGNHPEDINFFISAASYTEGLLWKAIDANPSGAKGPGYGSWQNPPNLEQNNHWSIQHLWQ